MGRAGDHILIRMVALLTCSVAGHEKSEPGSPTGSIASTLDKKEGVPSSPTDSTRTLPLQPGSPTGSIASTLDMEKEGLPSSPTDSTRTLPLQWANNENAQLGSRTPSMASTLSYHNSNHDGESDQESIEIESVKNHIMPTPTILKRKV